MATKLGKIVADFSTTLAAAIAVGGTSATLLSIVDDDGNNLPDGKYYFTIDGNNASKEHWYCTVTGSAITAILSVSRQGVTTSGSARAHRIGAQVVITDFAHIARINDLLAGTTDLNSAVPLKYDGVADMTGSTNKLATVKYVNDTALAGAPDASTTTKGVTKMSVAPASATAPIAVGDNDPRVPTAAQVGYIPTSDQKDALAGSGTPSGSNKFVTADTDALKELLANKDTDGTLAANSDTKYASQKATKTYIDLRSRPLAVRTSQQALGSNPSETDVIANTNVPGGSLSAGRAIRFEIYFTYVGSGGVATFKLYYGGSAVATISIGTTPANANTYQGHLVATIAYVGASSQYISGMSIMADNAVSAAASAVTSFVSTTSAVDESAAKNVKLTAAGNGSVTTLTIQGATIHLI